VTLAPRSFRLDIDGDGVAVLTLSDPATLNALTFESYRELGEVARSLATDERVRALVLTGEGSAFCSGGNVHTIVGALARAGADELRAFNRLTGESVRALRALPKPVIAAVNGVAVGGGAALALAADVRLAAPDARFGFVFARLGLSAADMGVSWLLPRVVGLGRATQLLLTGELVDADKAERWGLVTEVVGHGRVVERARAMAAALAAGPVVAHAETKRIVDEVAALDFDGALAREVEAQTRCMLTEDFREAARAFAEKRPPRFRGR
jgi:enoyl-CoA hydratase/carnithine racemase